MTQLKTSTNSEQNYCEMCGALIDKKSGNKVVVDRAILMVCSSCYAKLSMKDFKQNSTKNISTSLSTQSKSNIHKPVSSKNVTSSVSTKTEKERHSVVKKSNVDEKLELVDDFHEKIRKAREAIGWDQRTLAIKIKVSENVIKRIESGKLRPTVDLARKLEEVLNIKLLVPAVEDELKNEKISRYVTLGEIVEIRDEKR